MRDLQNKLSRVYTERNRCVALAARMALLLGCPAGVGRPDDANEDWAECLYIDLPTGQVSWHFHRCERSLFDDLPDYSAPWDGHSTEQKYHRVARAFPAERVVNVAEELAREIVTDESVREISMAALAATIDDRRASTSRRVAQALMQHGWTRQRRQLTDSRSVWVLVRPQGQPPARDALCAQLQRTAALFRSLAVSRSIEDIEAASELMYSAAEALRKDGR